MGDNESQLKKTDENQEGKSSTIRNMDLDAVAIELVNAFTNNVKVSNASHQNLNVDKELAKNEASLGTKSEITLRVQTPKEPGRFTEVLKSIRGLWQLHNFNFKKLLWCTCGPEFSFGMLYILFYYLQN